MLMKRTLFLFLTSVMVSLFALCAACGSKKGGEVVVNRGQAEKATSSPGKNEFPPLKTFQFATVKVDANGNVAERRKGEAQAYGEVINGVQLEMVPIPAGAFQMGSPDTEKQRDDHEGPQHQVTLPQFYVGKFEVTQAQWRAVTKLPKVSIDLRPDPSEFKGDDLPVEKVSWDEAMEFCARLSRATGRDYRLPSEAEWEYSARAGTQTPFAFGETITREIVNSALGSARLKTTAVGSLGVANGFGLYDTQGNVFEWCSDAWHEDYNGAPTNGTAWVSGGNPSLRVLRGGSWASIIAGYLRSANRYRIAPDRRDSFNGFRVIALPRT